MLDVTDITQPPRYSRPAVAGLVVAAAWLVLAAIRPTTTWHLAPALVVLVPGWIAEIHHPRRVLLTVIAAAAGAVTTLALHLLDWLQGPALIGHTATEEAAALIAAAAALDLLTVLRPRS